MLHAIIITFLETGAGSYSGCCYCQVQGEYCRNLDKMVYLNHRSFLPSSHPLHYDKKNFPQRAAPAIPPYSKNQHFIEHANKMYASAKTKKDKTAFARKYGFKEQYLLQKLPFHDRIMNTPVEPMHLLKDVVENLVRLLAGVTDTVKVRREEKS